MYVQFTSCVYGVKPTKKQIIASKRGLTEMAKEFSKTIFPKLCGN